MVDSRNHHLGHVRCRCRDVCRLAVGRTAKENGRRDLCPLIAFGDGLPIDGHEHAAEAGNISGEEGRALAVGGVGVRVGCAVAGCVEPAEGLLLEWRVAGRQLRR